MSWFGRQHGRQPVIAPYYMDQQEAEIAVGYRSPLSSAAKVEVVKRVDTEVVSNARLDKLLEAFQELAVEHKRMQTEITELKRLAKEMWYCPGMPGELGARMDYHGILEQREPVQPCPPPFPPPSTNEDDDNDSDGSVQ